jgi:hypothetical protein
MEERRVILLYSSQKKTKKTLSKKRVKGGQGRDPHTI